MHTVYLLYGSYDYYHDCLIDIYATWEAANTERERLVQDEGYHKESLDIVEREVKE